MDRKKWLVRRLFSARAFATLVLAAFVLAALVRTPPIAGAQGPITIETSQPYGSFNGIAYVRYSGRFEGLASGDYDVPFDIYAPADPAQGNGIAIVEPFHVIGGADVLQYFLTPEFFFERGFELCGDQLAPRRREPVRGVLDRGGDRDPLQLWDGAPAGRRGPRHGGRPAHAL